MKDSLDSLPIQTFLSALQFIQQSNVTISNAILTFKNDEASKSTHLANIKVMMALTTSAVSVIVSSADTEREAKLRALDFTNSEQVSCIIITIM